MTFSLEFDPRALKEWKRLDDTMCSQFKKKLASVMQNSRVEANRLINLDNC